VESKLKRRSDDDNQRKRKSKASKAPTHRHVAQATKAIILCEMLEALTRLAITYETAVVRETLVDPFSSAAGGEGSLKAKRRPLAG
jgi:hypothetical protein